IKYFLMLLFIVPLTIHSQTIKNPIDVKINVVSSTIIPGQRSAVEIVFKIPRGFWLGDNNLSSRIPPPVYIEMKQIENFNFEKPLFPESRVEGVPVQKGITHVYEGEIRAVVPFTTSKYLKDGDYTITESVTYTPGLNAGRLTAHVDEEYSITVKVSSKGQLVQSEIPKPFVGEVPESFFVAEEITELPEPLNSILYRWSEDSWFAKFIHWTQVDPDNHGKHIQTVVTPFYGFTENNGITAGMGMSLLNVTREGIMTGQTQIRGFYNQYVGTTFAFEAVSCPAAYFNYWVSGQISSGGQNKAISVHIENLTLGESDRFGYELFADAFRDPRYRFYGIGAGTKEEDKTNYAHQENSALLDIFWMPIDHIRFTVGGKIRNVDVFDGNDKIREFMPWTTDFIGEGGKFSNVPGIKGATVAGGRMSVKYDGRNSEFAPSAGFYGRLTAEYNHITEQEVTTLEKVENYGRFSADLRQYFSSPDQVMSLLLRASATFTTNKNIPFFEQAKLGGDFSNRGFDNNRFYGQHSIFASMEFRYQIMSLVVMGMPMDVEMAPFLDAGQVFDDNGFAGRFNVNPGMSLRILARPNLGIVGNAAIGQDGLIFTGGVALPF
ncbi:MAG: BamA/TamA family outer membrane protein, partial [Ignavibacteria bacterium]|nr:BamA/TamA family outer membrane protein [Ignavibacteria bacterium]